MIKTIDILAINFDLIYMIIRELFFDYSTASTVTVGY